MIEELEQKRAKIDKQINRLREIENMDLTDEQNDAVWHLLWSANLDL